MISKTGLTGRVIFKGDTGYNAARKNWDPHTNRFPKVFVTRPDSSSSIGVGLAVAWKSEMRKEW